MKTRTIEDLSAMHFGNYHEIALVPNAFMSTLIEGFLMLCAAAYNYYSDICVIFRKVNDSFLGPVFFIS